MTWKRTWFATYAALAFLGLACTGTLSEAGVTIREELGEPPVVPSEPSAQVLREVRVFGDPAPLGAIQQRLGVGPVMLDLGPHTFDELGISITLDFDEYWRLDNAQPGSFGITRPDAGLSTLLPVVLFHRPVGMAPPPLVASGRTQPGPQLWDAELSLSDWIDAVPQVVLLDNGTIDIGGRVAQWYDVDVDPALGPMIGGCQPGECVAMMWSGAHNVIVARDLERIRWYEIPDAQGPIVVVIATTDADFTAVTEDIHDLLLRAELGPSAPKPIPPRTAYSREIEIPANETWSFAGVPGLSITAPNAAFVAQRPGQVSVWRARTAQFSFAHGVVVPVSTIDGESLADREALASVVIDGAEIVEATSEDEILGRPATRIDFRHEGDGFLLLAPPRAGYASREAEWPTRVIHRVWVFDSPLGPAMVVISGETDFDFDAALESFDWFATTVGFCADSTVPTDSCPQPR